jgi:hypothetical protein
MLNRLLTVAVTMTVVVGSGVAATARAQTPSPLQSVRTAPGRATLVHLGSANPGPFQRLFVLPGDQALHTTPAQQLVLLDKPRVVCGMTVMPVEPRIDPKMRIEQKSEPVRFTIRTVPPSMCKGK